MQKFPEPAEGQVGGSDKKDPVEKNTIKVQVPEEKVADAVRREPVANSGSAASEKAENEQHKQPPREQPQLKVQQTTGGAWPSSVEGGKEGFVLGATAMEFGDH